MKVINHTFTSIDELDQQLDLSRCELSKTLVQVFSGLVEAQQLEKLHAVLSDKCGDICFIGTTTAGEINAGKLLKKSIVVSVIEFETVLLNSRHFQDETDIQSGKRLAATLVEPHTQALLLFVDGLFTNASEVLNGIASVASEIPVAGGLAGDNGFLEQTFIFNNQGLYSRGVVAVALNSTRLRVLSDYKLGWQPVGRAMTVTKVDRNRLYELDHMPVFEVYEKYMGEDISSRLPYSAVEFPLIKTDSDGIQVCRTFNRLFDDGSVQIIGDLSLGDQVHFSFGNIELILNDSTNNDHLQDFQVEAILVFSCIVRLSLLQSQGVLELKPLSEIAPSVGFLTYGEIFHHDSDNHLLTATLTTLALSEKPLEQSLPWSSSAIPTQNAKTKNVNSDKHYMLLKALTNLNNSIISELNEANQSLLDSQQQLKELANRDHLTNLYNRRYFFELAQTLLSSSKRNLHEFSVIIIDIDKFKAINDTFGHAAGDQALINLARVLQEAVRECDIVARFGGEEFVIFLPFTGIKDAVDVAQRLREIVEKNRIISDDQSLIHFTVSLGVSSMVSNDKSVLEQVINSADKALFQAKNQGRNRVCSQLY